MQKSMTGLDTGEGGQVVGLASPAAGAWGQDALWLHFNLLQAVTIVGVISSQAPLSSGSG